jgi:hypothetical protein
MLPSVQQPTRSSRITKQKLCLSYNIERIWLFMLAGGLRAFSGKRSAGYNHPPPCASYLLFQKIRTVVATHEQEILVTMPALVVLLSTSALLSAMALSAAALAHESHLQSVREMFSPKSNQMVEGSVCIGLRASCRVCARRAKWRPFETYSRTIVDHLAVGAVFGLTCSNWGTVRCRHGVPRNGYRRVPLLRPPSAILGLSAPQRNASAR